MTATCNFCGRDFANAQGVRAHLKACEAYRERPAKEAHQAASPRQQHLGSDSLGAQSLGSITPETEAPFDPVRQLQQRVATERLRLQLREVEEAHFELDRRAQSKERDRAQVQDQAADQARIAVKEREDGARRSADAAASIQRREAKEREQRERRRGVIQDVKRQTIDDWFLRFLLASDLKAQILQAIERELSELPVEELPLAELVQIAEGVRDRLHRDAKQIEAETREQERARQRLIQHGVEWASRELREADDLDLPERLRIEARVRRELQNLEGEETDEEVEDLVCDLIEEEGVLWDEGGA